jgi:hypothetical protein
VNEIEILSCQRFVPPELRMWLEAKALLFLVENGLHV